MYLATDNKLFSLIGLPHIHMLIVLHPEDKLKSPSDIDKIVSAEFPDKKVNPLLHKLVTDKMVHGPCTGVNHSSPCMVQNKCTKEFPKSFQEHTTTSEQGFTTYKRRSESQGGFFGMKKVQRKDTKITNKWVVPYNPLLLLKYKCHINTEVCTTTSSVKYLYKYILKGSDKVTVEVKKCDDKTGKTVVKDEIEAYAQGRYYDSTQSCHRIFGFQMCHRFPPVKKLPLHLEEEQIVLYNDDDNFAEVLDKFSKTELTEYFTLNQNDPRANDLLYVDIPKYYTFETKGGKKWKRRTNNRNDRDAGINSDALSPMVGRIPVIGLNQYTKEKFFMRLLLYHIKGAKSFKDLRTVIDENGEKIECATYQQACIKLGLTENDDEAREALREAFEHTKNNRLFNHFFVNIVIHCMAADPWALFNEFKAELCADKLHEKNLKEPTDEIVNEVLLELQEMFERQDKCLEEFIGLNNMPNPVAKQKNVAKELQCELDFIPEVQAEIAEKNESTLNEEQAALIKTLKDAIKKGEGGVFAVEAHGGTGKTYCINTLLAMLRAQKEIATAMAISGTQAS